MNVPNYYSSLPYDMSGSRTKNRFRAELLWGVSKMLDLMESGADFAVVFDYVCDVEVHFCEGFEFYQIKTHRGNTTSYNLKTLTQKQKETSEGSVLGKLYVLNKNGENNVKLAVVSNIPLKVSKKTLDQEEICFVNIPETEQSKIKEAIAKELGIKNVDLSNVYYYYTSMNLKEPKNEILGKLVVSFQKIKACEPIKPNALYRLIIQTVSEKACYEFSIRDYNELVKRKGVTREEFDRILNCHVTNEKTGIQQAQQYIDQMTSISEKRKYKKALSKMLELMQKSIDLKRIENSVARFLTSIDDIGAIEKAIDILEQNFDQVFPLEYENEEKTVFYIIIIYKYVEGAYDNEDAV